MTKITQIKYTEAINNIMNKFIKSYNEIINENIHKIFNFSYTGIKNIITDILKNHFTVVKFFRGMSTFTFSKIIVKYGNQKYIKNYQMRFEYIPNSNKIKLLLTELIGNNSDSSEQNIITPINIEITQEDSIDSLKEKIETEIRKIK